MRPAHNAQLRGRLARKVQHRGCIAKSILGNQCCPGPLGWARRGHMADNQRLTEDEKVLHGMGYAQELTRRMGAFQNFAISFAIICIVAGGITAFPVALSAGGGAAVGIVWPLGSAFALLVAAALGQVASSYPTAGGIYHWSSILGGRGFGWASAWFNLLGLMFVVSSVNWGLFNLFRDLFLAQVLGWDVTSWIPSGEFSGGWWIQTIFITTVTVAQACSQSLFPSPDNDSDRLERLYHFGYCRGAYAGFACFCSVARLWPSLHVYQFHRRCRR